MGDWTNNFTVIALIIFKNDIFKKIKNWYGLKKSINYFDFFNQFFDNFSTLLLCKINFLDIFNMAHLFQIFVISQSTEILIESNFWLGRYGKAITHPWRCEDGSQLSKNRLQNHYFLYDVLDRLHIKFANFQCCHRATFVYLKMINTKVARKFFETEIFSNFFDDNQNHFFIK